MLYVSRLNLKALGIVEAVVRVVIKPTYLRYLAEFCGNIKDVPVLCIRNLIRYDKIFEQDWSLILRIMK